MREMMEVGVGFVFMPCLAAAAAARRPTLGGIWAAKVAGPATSARPDPLYFKKLGFSVWGSRNPGLDGRADRPFSGPS